MMLLRSVSTLSERAAGFQNIYYRQKHSVRLILTSNIGENKAGEVVNVSAGYARNFLIPKKMALYAIPQNFERLGIKDPNIETPEQRKERLEQEARYEADEELQAAKLLSKYLENKVLKIWRNVDPKSKLVHPGMVDQKALRQKLSKQLKIDLDNDEQVHIKETSFSPYDNLTQERLNEILEDIDTSSPCKVQIRELGIFIAKLSLSGGYTVPLKFTVLKR